MTKKLKLVVLSALTFIMTMAPIDAGAATFTAAPGPNVIQASSYCLTSISWPMGSWVEITPTVSMCSENLRYKAVFQGDGNWVVYDKGWPIWNSKTAGNYNSRLVFQQDRNIVIYRANGTPAWSTGTYVANIPNHLFRLLIMQNDGNLVYYEQGNARVPLWSSKTGKL